MLSYANVGTGSGGAGASTVSLQVTFDQFAGQNGVALNMQLFNPNSPCTPQIINLISGNNAINTTTCPAMVNASGVFICPPVGNGAVLTIKGITGDTGIAIAYAATPNVPPTFLPFAASPITAFVINANSTVTGLLLIWV